jgi:hypothetical protein
MRKSVRRLRLSRETLRSLEAKEYSRVAGQQLPSAGLDNCTEGSCTYFVCEPSNPYPCDNAGAMPAFKAIGPAN